ncbi:hypothetical protein MDA_GLEAN10003339 [Myotis davidii]|uniref:Uncharacterized protein n=1 Tax=Myotis davidii TaxID=225400 RepID=L5M5S2_MYODS|nr:hypothetical protein MDA_GLEAN10003339 [Myotis davidii]
MTAIMAPEKSSPGLRCWLILTFTVFLQCVCVAMASMHFTSELQQGPQKAEREAERFLQVRPLGLFIAVPLSQSSPSMHEATSLESLRFLNGYHYYSLHCVCFFTPCSTARQSYPALMWPERHFEPKATGRQL